MDIVNCTILALIEGGGCELLFSQKMSAGKKWKRRRRKLYSKIPLSCQEFSVELFEMLIVKLLFVLVEKGSVLFKEESRSSIKKSH